jgi:hypothetical protein
MVVVVVGDSEDKMLVSNINYEVQGIKHQQIFYGCANCCVFPDLDSQKTRKLRTITRKNYKRRLKICIKVYQVNQCMIHDVYGYPIYVGKVLNVENIFEHMKDFLEKNRIYKSDLWNASCLTTSTDGTSSNVTQYYSEHIATMIQEHKDKMLNDIGIKDKIKTTCSLCRDPDCVKCTDMWINVYTKGMSQGGHWHIEGKDNDPFLSFVYFVRYNPKSDAKLVFLNPAPKTNCEKLLNVKAYKRNTEIPIEENDVIIFPSFMIHCVEEQKTDGPRITISGNLYEQLKD